MLLPYAPIVDNVVFVAAAVVTLYVVAIVCCAVAWLIVVDLQRRMGRQQLPLLVCIHIHMSSEKKTENRRLHSV